MLLSGDFINTKQHDVFEIDEIQETTSDNSIELL